MKTLALACMLFCSRAVAQQSFKDLKVLAGGTLTVGGITSVSVSSASPALTVTQSGAGLAARFSGDVVAAYADNSFFSVDAAGLNRLGFTKKTGAIPQLTYGSGNNFEISQSSTTGINAGSTYTTRMRIGITGIGEFLGDWNVLSGTTSLRDATVVANNAGSAFVVQQSGTGNGAVFQNIGGVGNAVVVSGGASVDTATFSGTATFNGVTTLNGVLAGTHGQNVGTGDSPVFLGINYNAAAGSTRGPSWRTSGVGRWAAYVTGAESGSNTGGDWALNRYDDAGTFVSAAISAVRSTGVVSIPFLSVSSGLSGTHGQNVGTGDTPTFYGVTLSSTGSLFIGASSSIALNGTMSGTHGQNVGTGDSPTFNALTVSSCTGCGSGGVTSVTASSPLVSSGGATPNLTCSTCLIGIGAAAPTRIYTGNAQFSSGQVTVSTGLTAISSCVAVIVNAGIGSADGVTAGTASGGDCTFYSTLSGFSTAFIYYMIAGTV